MASILGLQNRYTSTTTQQNTQSVSFSHLADCNDKRAAIEAIKAEVARETAEQQNSNLANMRTR